VKTDVQRIRDAFFVGKFILNSLEL